jgi:SAM-dependent methyltransferase
MLRRLRGRFHRQALNRLRAAVAEAPGDPGRHTALAAGMDRAGRVYGAHASLRSAAFLQKTSGEPSTEVKEHRVPFSELRCMDHNQFFRFETLSKKVQELSGSERLSILDVGGGDGQLAQFLPETGYFLVEPSVNGISGEHLPFGEASFDYVVACHVLEHIPAEQRFGFLDSLLKCARRGVVLLNPFFDERTSVDERLRLIIQVTNAPWAKEHLDCSLPELGSIEQYAVDRNLDIDCEPNGFLPLSAAMVFSNYFGSRLARTSDLRAINEYFNTKLAGLLNSSHCPNAYLITLKRRQAIP